MKICVGELLKRKNKQSYIKIQAMTSCCNHWNFYSFPQECPARLSNFLTWGLVGDFGNIPIRGIQSFPQEFPAGPSNLLTWGNVGYFVINPIRGKPRFPLILPGWMRAKLRFPVFSRGILSRCKVSNIPQIHSDFPVLFPVFYPSKLLARIEECGKLPDMPVEISSFPDFSPTTTP